MIGSKKDVMHRVKLIKTPPSASTVKLKPTCTCINNSSIRRISRHHIWLGYSPPKIRIRSYPSSHLPSRAASDSSSPLVCTIAQQQYSWTTLSFIRCNALPSTCGSDELSGLMTTFVQQSGCHECPCPQTLVRQSQYIPAFLSTSPHTNAQYFIFLFHGFIRLALRNMAQTIVLLKFSCHDLRALD